MRRRVPNRSAITEWSITRSAGASGLTFSGIAAQVADGLAHGGQVDDARHPGEVLHHHARGRVLDLNAGFRLGIPVRDGLDVVLGDVAAVLVAQQVLGEDLEAVGEFLRIGDGVETVDLVTLIADLEGVAGSERVH